MKKFVLTSVLFSIICFMSSCTYNISMAHTSGTADDVIDDAASNTPNISPTSTL